MIPGSKGGAGEGERASRAVVGAAGARRIVIVGGGAGGFALAARLSRTLDRRSARITLVDAERAHLWKPLLHEVAAGTLRPHRDFLPYARYAARHDFVFIQARMESLDRARRELGVDPTGGPPGLASPRRAIPYDILVIAIGSVHDDRAVPGVAEHALFLDTVGQAERIEQSLLLACLRAQNEKRAEDAVGVAIVVVGGGAIGVEFAAELRRAANALVAQGFDRLTPERGVCITLLEAEQRVLPALPRTFSEATARRLTRRGVAVLCGERVTRVRVDGVETEAGLRVPATLTIWAAGSRAPSLLASLAGLETNESRQLVVGLDLKTTRDQNIFAIGDCAAIPWADHREGVPPTARAASEQAAILARTLVRRGREDPGFPFVYKDRGLLASLGQSAFWAVFGRRLPRLVGLEAWRARFAYRVLYKKHRLVLRGVAGEVLATLRNLSKLHADRRLKRH